jgi:FkbH-like protein
LAELDWLPELATWDQDLKVARSQPPGQALPAFQALAASRVDLVRTEKLDRAAQKYLAEHSGEVDSPTVRIALLGSSTLSHLVSGIRVGCLRRGLIAEIYEARYGSYRQELADPGSALHAFRPHVLLLALDARHLTMADSATADDALESMRACWRAAREQLHCAVIQQTALPCLPPLLGNNEHQVASPGATVQRINERLRKEAAEHGVHLLSIDQFSFEQGLAYWHDPALWHRAKQEVHPRAGGLYGEQVGRIVGALRGKSCKCLVLDLDNTLWGGVIGDDGLAGIVLGQGNALGEAYLAFQRYAQALSRRGVILAVCSKNDPANAMLPFESHPEMVLNKEDIAVFVANWQDKASNLRAISQSLNIGLDSLVFVDDNPVERLLVRRELPMVGVPELPEDPAYYVDCLSRAGYFEALAMTEEDRERTSQYRANLQREELRSAATDMDSFLRDLKMELGWQAFSPHELSRVVQLINKTNQFNLTTRRYLESQVVEMLSDPRWLTLQFRLTDVYGNNGIIAIVIGELACGGDLRVDTWLMSCRVLGRKVECATLGVLVEQAREKGAVRLVGEHRPTAKNGMVRDHYRDLGFQPLESLPDGTTRWALDLAGFQPEATHIRVCEEMHDSRRLQPAH